MDSKTVPSTMRLLPNSFGMSVKRLLVIIFLIAVMICGLVLADTMHLGKAQNPSTTASTPAYIANTNSDGSLQYTHQVVVRLPNGTLCATFSSNLLGTINNYAVYVVSSNDNGSTWGIPTKISNATGMDSPLCNQGAYGCVIAADANNNLYVAWTGVADGSTYFQVWCARYNGSVWSTPIQVSQGAGDGVQAFYASIAVDGNNKVHLVWDSFINGYSNERIFYAKYNGTWSSPVAISTQPNNALNMQAYPCIAVDSNNRLHVVWTGGSNSIYGARQVWYARYDGAWQVPVVISNRSDLNNHYMNAPCIAIDSNNNLHVVWNGACDSIMGYDQIWYVKRATSWSSPIRISNATIMSSSSQVYPSIAIDSQNQVHVAWTSEREHVLFYANYTTSWSTPVQLEVISSSYPHFRWSFYPASNSITSKLDFVFLTGSVLAFDSGLGSSPSISASITPISTQIIVGQSMAFSSTVTGGTSPYKYQWYLNGTLFSGATSASWTFTPSMSGTYSAYVVVTDSVNTTVQSVTGTVYVLSSAQSLTGIFGYSNASSQGGGSGTQYTADGSRFTLDVEANITSMSCLMSYVVNPVQPNASYSYRFAIYRDSGGAVGNLLAQTEIGEIFNAGEPPKGDNSTEPDNSTKPIPNSDGLWKALNFARPVHLTPGAYWLMVVHDASQVISVHSAVQDIYESVYSVIGSMTFPASLNSPVYTFGQVHCIYASWEINFAAILSEEQSVFSLSSNSTISSLAFNSAKKELSFTVNGSQGTTGYTQVFISKTMLPDVTGVTVTLDGGQLSFTASSLGDFRSLYFVYSHSTHNVAISMLANVIPESPTPFLVASLAITFATLLCLMYFIKRYFNAQKKGIRRF